MKNHLKIAVVLLLATIAAIDSAHAQRGRQRQKTVVVSRPAHRTVVRRSYGGYSGMPHYGASVNVVPTGAVMLKYHRNPYYFHNGIYYTQRNNSYYVVRPRRGLRVAMLPVGYRTVAVGPRSYFYYYGTYYQPAANGYAVVDPPVGAVVDGLPDGYTVQNINGIEYYMLDGVTYAEVDAPEFPDGVGYEVVRI